MNVRRFRALCEAGASYAEIAAECGVDWRTAKKYLQQPVGATPPTGSSRRGCQPRVIAPLAGVVDAWLRRNIRMKASVIYERPVAEHGFAYSYQRVKMYVAEARPRIAAEMGARDEPMAGLHRRFEVSAGSQAQVDWGDEGAILAHVGIAKVYSFRYECVHRLVGRGWTGRTCISTGARSGSRRARRPRPQWMPMLDCLDLMLRWFRDPVSGTAGRPGRKCPLPPEVPDREA